MNILYVEDCEITIELLQMNMSKHCAVDDLSLEVAGTVADAIQVFSVEKHRAVLIDWNLPDGSGLEVARHIRSMDKTLPLVFLSAALREDHRLEAEKYHPKGCLAKGHGKAYIDTILQLLL